MINNNILLNNKGYALDDRYSYYDNLNKTSWLLTRSNVHLHYKGSKIISETSRDRERKFCAKMKRIYDQHEETFKLLGNS